ncbi:hypothetical protein Taro_027808 [Colocasia esculenta]|uniref:Calmodulin-binding heat-shock protein n=1 Tax=Colocasia esculenta TaxID=4460 RepID=A0A843VEV6_COLES|nr:hypothetical protein [Colocasia esculenta]
MPALRWLPTGVEMAKGGIFAVRGVPHPPLLLSHFPPNQLLSSARTFHRRLLPLFPSRASNLFSTPQSSPSLSRFAHAPSSALYLLHNNQQQQGSKGGTFHGEEGALMSLTCGVECVVCLGCSRWAWKRCTYVGSYDSETWVAADPADFEPVPRICRIILAVYEEDLAHPQFPPPGGYRLNPAWVVKRVTYEETEGNSPPYLIYTDHDAREIVLAIRGLNLARESDYALLLDNGLGMQMFDGGYVHHGLLKSAIWLLKRESETLTNLWKSCGPDYKMVFAGHSLGSGVAALMTVVVVNHRDFVGGIPRSQVRCYAVAPARCMSLNLAVKYADVIYSIDDFLPRTPTPLEDIFKSIFCLPCLLFLVCLRDTFIPESKKLRDPRRLYAPGRMYHIVERKFCRY